MGRYKENHAGSEFICLRHLPLASQALGDSGRMGRNEENHAGSEFICLRHLPFASQALGDSGRMGRNEEIHAGSEFICLRHLPLDSQALGHLTRTKQRAPIGAQGLQSPLLYQRIPHKPEEDGNTARLLQKMCPA